MSESEQNSGLPIQFTEEKLLESLHNLHASARLAKQIEVEENKLNALAAIRERFSAEPQSSTSTLKTALSNIETLETSIAKLKSEKNAAEQKVVQGFQEILSKLSSTSDLKSNAQSAQIRNELHTKIQSYTNGTKEQIAALESKVTELARGKLDATAEKALYQVIEGMKTEVRDVQRQSIADISRQRDDRFKQMEARCSSIIAKFSTDNILADVQKRIQGSTDAYLKAFFKEINAENAKAQGKLEQREAEKVKQYVTETVLSHVSTEQLQKVIQGLPEFQKLSSALEDSQPTVDLSKSSDFVELKQSLMLLSNEMALVKQKTDATRALVKTWKQYGQPGPSQVDNFDLAASAKHIEDISREITLMYNSVKMMEAVMEVGTAEGSRKRRKLDEEVDETLKTRLDQVEQKYDALKDYISQYERTVLNDNYPDRLNFAMTKIHQTLRNHEQFIAFLVDPFSRTPSDIKLPEKSQPLSEAMSEAIEELVHKASKEVVEPLQEKIKLLEEQLAK